MAVQLVSKVVQVLAVLSFVPIHHTCSGRIVFAPCSRDSQFDSRACNVFAPVLLLFGIRGLHYLERGVFFMSLLRSKNIPFGHLIKRGIVLVWEQDGASFLRLSKVTSSSLQICFYIVTPWVFAKDHAKDVAAVCAKHVHRLSSFLLPESFRESTKTTRQSGAPCLRI